MTEEYSSSRDHAPTITSGKGTLTLAALATALFVSGCGKEPELLAKRFPGMEVISISESRVLLRQPGSGCMWEGESWSASLQPIVTPEGKHAGCAALRDGTGRDPSPPVTSDAVPGRPE